MSTARFGLSDSVDHAVIDAVLAALETHDHTGGKRVVGPVGVPSLLQSPNNGSLPGSTTFYYRYSFVDRYGFETAACGEVGITTPEIITPPQPPELSGVEGGILAPGLYYYFLTAVVDVDDETQLSGPAVITVVPGEGSVQVDGPLVDQVGLDGYNVWRQGPGEACPTKVGTFTVEGDGFLDDGSVPADDRACDSGKMPPAFTLTNSTNAVTVSMDPDDAATLAAGAVSGQISRWRIYRTLTSGGFSNRSLLVTVGPDADGELPSLYVDNGSATPVQGAPSDVDRTLHPSVKIKSGGDGNVENPTLMSADHTVWTVDVGPTGEVWNRRAAFGTGYALGRGPILTSANARTWRLAMDNDGFLVTGEVVPIATDTLYLADQGPLLASTATVRYRLGVSDTGAVTLTLIEPPAYPAGQGPVVIGDDGNEYMVTTDGATAVPA